MFYSLFPLILIFVGIAAIVVIVARKFPPLSALDVEKLPEVQQAKVKDEIKFQRFWRSFSSFGRYLKKIFSRLEFVKNGWQWLQGRFRRLVHHWQEKYKKSIIAEIKQAMKEAKGRRAEEKEIRTDRPPCPVGRASDLLKQAEEAAEKGDWPLAERYFIEAVKHNPKEIEAYRGLGKVYLEMKKYKEARETFEFILKLKPDDDRAYNRLSMVAEARGNWLEAIKCLEEAVKLNDRLAVRFYDLGRFYFKLKKPAAALRHFARAAEIEANNPKYLDQLLEMSIITGDGDLARETYDKLRLVNPDNQKLPEFRQRIEEMEE